MVCVGLRERSIGKAATSLQLFSQGTADIILDACIDFWDGHDLSPVSPSVRYLFISITIPFIIGYSSVSQLEGGL